MIRLYKEIDKRNLIPLIARFRIELQLLKNVKKTEFDYKRAEQELNDYVQKNYPIFVAIEETGVLSGYIVGRIEEHVIWAESLYVLPELRRKGIASSLYEKIEEIALKLNSETVYNWVHPNNDKIIKFLNKRGYNVLNLIVLRKERNQEVISSKITVGDHSFNY